MCPLQTNDPVLAKLVQDSPLAIVVSTLVDGQILEVNDSFVRLFGYDRDEVIGHTSVELDLWADPVQRAELTAALLEGQPLRDFSARVRAKTGAERQVLGAVAEVEIEGRACLLTQLYDITAYRQTETRFQALVEQLPVITYIHGLDAPLTMTYISPQVETMLGYSPAEVLTGQPDFLTTWTHPEDRASVREAVERTRATGAPFRSEYRIQARDGRWVWLRDQATLIRDDVGTPLYWQGIMADITEQRQAQEERDRAERHSRDLFEDAPIMYVITRNEAGNPIIADCNATFLTALRYERQEVIGRALAEFYTPESREALLAGGYATALAGSMPATERQLLTKNGQILDVLLVARPEAENDPERPGTRVSFVDVTARKAAEEALRRSEVRFATVFHASPVAIVIRSLVDGRFRDVNDHFLEMTGYAREEVVGRTPAEVGVWAGSPEDDRTGVAGRVRADGRVRNHEGTYCTRAGELRHVLLSLERIELEGESCLLGFGYDVTERKRMEEELRRSEERFRALVQNSYDVTTILDPDGTRRYTSPSIDRLLGYHPADLLGRSPTDLIHPDDAPRLQEAIQSFARGIKETSVLELRFRHRDGSWRDFEAIGTNLLDEPSIAGIVFNSRDITVRKAAQAALWESEERFRSAFAHAATGMALIAEDDRFLQVNHSLCTILASSEAELLAKSVAEMTFPEDRNVDGDLVQQLLRGEIASYQVEKRLVRKPEEVIWGRLTVSLVRGSTIDPRYFVAQIQDITPFKAAGAALRESEERFRSAFDHAPIGMALRASDGRFTQVNRALCELVGYAEAELLGKTFQAITHPDDLADDLELTARLWAGEIDSYQLEKRYLHKDGHVIWIQLTASVARDAGGPKYTIAQTLDITDRRQLEMDRAAMLDTVRDYARRLRDLTEMRADLTAMIAHELRGPVSALRMMTSVLKTGELLPQDETEMLATFEREIEQLDRLVSDVAAVTAAEREGFPVQVRPTSVAMLLRSAAAYARSALSEELFTLVPPPEVEVRCDPDRISQVLNNLLDNAAKHTPPGTPFELRAHRRGPRVRIEVVDQGPGLPAEDVALIFEKFGRGRQAAQRQVSGMGLGLYLSRQIVRAHGSELTVESAPGRGTVFAFELEVVS